MTSGASAAIDQMKNKGKLMIYSNNQASFYVYGGSSWHWINSSEIYRYLYS
jgi:hypothetical protein